MRVPDDVCNEIIRAVEAAVNADIDPASFVATVQTMWEHTLHEKARIDNKTFDKMLKAAKA